METCPQCEGNPQHVTIVCGPGGCRETVLSCDFCGGLRIVAVEAADAWRKGRALRDERVKAGLSPAEGAALRGLTVFEQNEIENGRAEIPARLLSRSAE
jgi:hypothetical protein